MNHATFIRRSELDERSVQRDYNFLTQLDRKLGVKRQDSRQNKVLKRQKVQENLVKRGVNVQSLPRGMQRAAMNKSGWDKKREMFVWTLEFQLVENGIVVESAQSMRVPEATPIRDAVHFKIKERVDDEFQCYLRLVGFPADKPMLKPLPLDALLGEALKGETVIEFPTIIVSSGEVTGFGVRNCDESDSNESDSSDDDSESSDSSESESDREDSGDDEPEEESSKKGPEDERGEGTEGREDSSAVVNPAAAAPAETKISEGDMGLGEAQTA